MSTNFGQYDFLQILHQNQLTSQQKISALFQVEDLYQRRMYGLYKIQQKKPYCSSSNLQQKCQKILVLVND